MTFESVRSLEWYRQNQISSIRTIMHFGGRRKKSRAMNRKAEGKPFLEAVVEEEQEDTGQSVWMKT